MESPHTDNSHLAQDAHHPADPSTQTPAHPTSDAQASPAGPQKQTTHSEHGNSSKLTLRTSNVHKILWFNFAPGDDEIFHNLLEVIADGRPLEETPLRWDTLIGAVE